MAYAQRDVFHDFMRAVWGDNEDGPNYDTYSDAFEVARVMGAKPTGQHHDDGDKWHEFLFADGSTTWIVERGGHGAGIDHNPSAPSIERAVTEAPLTVM